MIAFFSACFGLAISPAVVENIEPQAHEVSIEIIARIPKLTAKQQDSLETLSLDLPRRVEGMGPRDIAEITNGDVIRCRVGPDYILLSFHVPSNNWRSGLALAEALVRHSQLEPPPTISDVAPSAWIAALRPFKSMRKPRPVEIEDLYRTLFRPENITLGIGGAIAPGQARQNWLERMSTWTPARIVPPNPYEPSPKFFEKNPGELDSVDIEGPIFTSADPSFASNILALFALGSGKGASLFRVARQKLGFSYRQEALLYPVPEGWQARLILVRKPADDLTARAEFVRSSLVSDVANWNDENLQRAIGMAEGVLLRGVEFSPFAFGPGGATDSTLEGRTFLSTYWQVKTGQPWEPDALLSQLRQVSLPDLKASATNILTQGKVRLLPGR